MQPVAPISVVTHVVPTDVGAQMPTRTVPLCANLTAVIVPGMMRQKVGTVVTSTSVKAAVHLYQRVRLPLATLATKVTVYAQTVTARVMQVPLGKTLVSTTPATPETLVTAAALILVNVAMGPVMTPLYA